MCLVKNFTCLLSVPGLLLFAALCVSGCSRLYDGEKLFFQVGCSQCHTYQGRGGRIGPDLTGVADRRTAGWIADYLQDPQKVNPDARMPSFAHLPKAKRRAIIRFLTD